MNQSSKKPNEYYDNYMAIAKVLSLLKNFDCKEAQDIVSVNTTRRVLRELQTQEWKKDNPHIILEVS